MWLHIRRRGVSPAVQQFFCVLWDTVGKLTRSLTVPRAEQLCAFWQDVTSLYTLGRVLGRGQFGTTRLAEDKLTGEQLACKSISKRKLTYVTLLCSSHTERLLRTLLQPKSQSGSPMFVRTYQPIG